MLAQAKPEAQLRKSHRYYPSAEHNNENRTHPSQGVTRTVPLPEAQNHTTRDRESTGSATKLLVGCYTRQPGGR